MRTWYYSQGTQIYCAPTVDARPLWQNTMTHVALEGRCFVLSACQFAQEKDYPPDHAVVNAEARDPSNVMIAGGSVIINPLGQVLAGPLLGEEGIISADLDMDDWYRGKFDLDTTGHYARNDSECWFLAFRSSRILTVLRKSSNSGWLIQQSRHQRHPEVV